MVLISVVSSYQLLEALLLKAHKYREQDVVLLCSNFLTINYPHYNELHIYFKDIIIFSVAIQCENDILEDKKNYFDCLLNEYNYKINEFEEIYCAAAHHSFGVYLCQKQCNFIFLEDGAGMLSSYKDLARIEYGINHKKTELIDKMGLFSGTSKYINYIIADKNKLPDNFIHEKEIVHFSIQETLLNINEKERAFITSFFGFLDKIVINDNSCILFTEHFANLKIFTYQYQCKIYQFLIDYFFQDYNLVIKPHPDDIAYYSLLFPNATIIRTKFPAEIFPYIITQHPKYIAGISSTSVHNISYMKSDIFSLDFNARNEHVVDSFHKYYVIAKLLETYKNKIKIYINNVYTLLFSKIIEFNTTCVSYNLSHNINDCNIAIIDGTNTEELLNHSNIKTIFFLSNPFNYIDKEKIYKHIYPLKISKTKQRNDFIFDNCDTEYIYIYDRDISKEIEHFMHKFELKNSGIELKAETLTEEKLQIAILEGILEATEKRLLYEIESNKNIKKDE